MLLATSLCGGHNYIKGERETCGRLGVVPQLMLPRKMMVQLKHLLVHQPWIRYLDILKGPPQADRRHDVDLRARININVGLRGDDNFWFLVVMVLVLVMVLTLKTTGAVSIILQLCTVQ